MINLNELKTTELKQLGEQFQLKGWWNMKKEELISTIEKAVSASDEALEILNEYEKEKIAIDEYVANWTKYTKRHNVSEFLEKWKSGEIVLESERAATDSKQVEAPESRSEDTSDVENINNQDEPENAIENESKAPDHALEQEIEEPQSQPKETSKPKRGALIEFEGKSQNICAWGKELGISPNTLYGRLYKLGWPVEKAFTKK